MRRKIHASSWCCVNPLRICKYGKTTTAAGVKSIVDIEIHYGYNIICYGFTNLLQIYIDCIFINNHVAGL